MHVLDTADTFSSLSVQEDSTAFRHSAINYNLRLFRFSYVWCPLCLRRHSLCGGGKTVRDGYSSSRDSTVQSWHPWLEDAATRRFT